MDLRQWLIAIRLTAVCPWRQCQNRQDERAGRAPLMVLFYHRVADMHPNSWTIGCELFRRQIDWLQHHVELISLQEIQRRIVSGRNHRLAAAITFDDGYAENCDFALPLLIERKLPCTYFVASRHMLHGEPFPHDVEAGQPLPPNTPEQIQRLANNGIEIGAHTRRHVDLGPIQDAGVLADEIIGSGEDLAEVTGRRVHYFAFPYGQPSNLSSPAFQMARDHGYAGVCTAYGGYNFPGGDAFQLQRIHADPEMTRFRNWLTFDRRKLALHPPYRASTPQTPSNMRSNVQSNGQSSRLSGVPSDGLSEVCDG